jgi:hypothetical protein
VKDIYIVATDDDGIFDIGAGAQFDKMADAENRARFERHFHAVKIFKVVETHHYEKAVKSG